MTSITQPDTVPVPSNDSSDVVAQLTDSITNPSLVFATSHFFIDHWLPILGPRDAWLVIALQQARWRGSTAGSIAYISHEQLGSLSGLSDRQVREHLNNPDSYLGSFIVAVHPRYRNGRRQANGYELRMPLTPTLAAGLAAILAASSGFRHNNQGE